MGVWPPMKRGGRLPPLRAFWPFVPLPAVLTWPEPCPRPTRFLSLFAPWGGRRSLSCMSLSSLIGEKDILGDTPNPRQGDPCTPSTSLKSLHLEHVSDLVDLAAYLR